MFFHTRVALGVALLIAATTSVTVFAKGNFAFISIAGPNLKEAVRSTDPALTTDFLAFFDFSDQTKAPADPGPGYEVTRYYVDGKRETAFDHLHYYPDTGFVYYDGIVNGSSEYDGKWYNAKLEIKAPFEKALGDYAESIAPSAQSQPAPFLDRPQSILLVVAMVSLVIVLMLASRFRKPATR